MEVIKKIQILCIIFLFLSCSSSKNNNSIKEIWDLYKVQNQEKPIVPITQSMVKFIPYPLIEVRSNGFIKQLLMIPISNRNGITNYISGSGQSLTLQGNLVTKTNGINEWLLSVDSFEDSPFTKQKNIDNWPKTNDRNYTFLNPDNKKIEVQVNCDLTIKKKEEELEVAESVYSVFYVEETCKGKNTNFKNIYWVEKNGFVRKSVQWISLKGTKLHISILKKE